MRDDRSFIELKARQRAHALLDEGSYRELLDPFEGVMSPWLGAQGIVPQADDGMVVAKGTINGKPAVVVAIEGAFQGGSMGEVSGAKMAAALELAAEDNSIITIDATQPLDNVMSDIRAAVTAWFAEQQA